MVKYLHVCLALASAAILASACEPEDATNRVSYELADTGATHAVEGSTASVSNGALAPGTATEAMPAVSAAPSMTMAMAAASGAGGVGDAASLIASAPVLTLTAGAVVPSDGITANLGGMMMGGMMMGGDMSGSMGMGEHGDMSGMMSGMGHMSDTMMGGMGGMNSMGAMGHMSDTMMGGMTGMNGMGAMGHMSDTMMGGMGGMNGMDNMGGVMGMGTSMAVPHGNAGAGGPVTMTATAGAAAAPTITVDTAFLASASPDLLRPGDARQASGQLAREWMELARRRVMADKMSPPVAARAYGYLGVAMYESVVHGAGDQRSLAKQLAGLDQLPLPGPGEYHWPTVMAATLEGVAKTMFPSPSSQAIFAAARDKQVAAARRAGVSQAVVDRSLSYGRTLAAAIVAWSASDGYADTRLKTYTVPTGPGRWAPTGAVTMPLEPHWGELRPMTPQSAGACGIPKPIVFATDQQSAFYAQAKAVYDKSKSLSDAERQIAQYWADGTGKTTTPAGHWESIVGQVVLRDKLSLVRAAEIYALTSIAMSDAFISCWATKFEYDLVRPQTYIQQNIDPAWKPLLDTPPFPEYPSGHSTGSAAAAAVLTALAAPGPITDRANEGTPLGTRTFATFADAAAEAKMSRLYAGIHYPNSNEQGATQGACIGKRTLNQLKTRK